MYCSKCGSPLDGDANFCPRCGAKALQSSNFFSQSQSPEEDLASPFPLDTRQEFYKFYASRKTTGWTKAFVIISFLSAGLGTIYLCLGSYLSVLDIAVYLSMGILLLRTKHWVCALIPTIYSGFASLINLAVGGSFSGIFAIVCGILCTINLYKINQAFLDYQYFGTVPKAEI